MAMSILEQIRAEKKARDARFAAAAMKVQQQAKAREAAEAKPDIAQDNFPRVRLLPSRPLAVVVSPTPFGPFRPGENQGPSTRALNNTERRASQNMAYLYTRLAQELRDEILANHNVALAEFEGDYRQLRVTTARQEVMWALYVNTNWTWMRIARFCGRSDHTTAIKGYRSHVKRLAAGGVYKWRNQHGSCENSVKSPLDKGSE